MGPRTVVFRVCGLITLKPPIKVTEPLLTRAGPRRATTSALGQ
jgi:hypothetical protein